MTASTFRLAVLGTLLAHALAAAAQAQTNEDRGSFAIREVSLSSGYAFVQLPPITLGGHQPPDVLASDLISTATAHIDWRRITARTRYRFELFGAYSARARYSQLNAPGTSATFGVSRALGRRWRVGAGAANAIVGSDQVVFHQTGTRRTVDEAASFDDLAGRGTGVRSPHPDPAAAALFIPISQSFTESDLFVNRVMATGVEGDASYVHSRKLATYFHGSYTNVRRISSNHDADDVLAYPDSRAQTAGVRVRYNRSERTGITASLNWSQASGVFTHEGVSAAVGYGWSGRRWFAELSAGAMLPLESEADAELPAADRGRNVGAVVAAALGYKFRTQTLLVQYRRAPHDDYGNGGRNVATGFEADIQSLAGSWSWSSPRSRWVARSDFSLVRRPGNFSNIYAWLATAGVGRRVGRDVRVMGEVLFDRHGSRGFEGFALMREGVRMSLEWTPGRRRVRSIDSDRASE